MCYWWWLHSLTLTSQSLDHRDLSEPSCSSWFPRHTPDLNSSPSPSSLLCPLWTSPMKVSDLWSCPTHTALPLVVGLSVFVSCPAQLCVSVISYIYLLDHFNLPFKAFPVLPVGLDGILSKCDVLSLTASLGLCKSTVWESVSEAAGTNCWHW